ncbi:MAG: formate/nitrite transporter family protein [Chloroflexi bacterium]|nr:formate/nitrite transporter family protein [Chloroflexota bacterium]
MAIDICETCGCTFHKHGETCPDCGAHLADRGEIRRLPHDVVLRFLDHAEEFFAAGPLRQLVLAFAAGSFITFGAVLSVALTVDVDSVGISRLLLGLGFSAGFILVILSGSALFTEINVLLPEMFLSRPRDLCRRCWPFWFIAIVGNLMGALFVGSMISGAHVLGPLQEERLFELLEEKMQFQELGTEGWFVVLVSGILGNWLVGMAAFLATAARTVTGKILGLVFPIVTFVAIGVQHAPANMGYFATGLIGGGSGVGWGEAIWWNLVPASLGNIIGGALFVALLFWYTYGRDAEQRQALRRAGEMARKRGS